MAETTCGFCRCLLSATALLRSRGRGNIKLISEGTAIQTERSFVGSRRGIRVFLAWSFECPVHCGFRVKLELERRINHLGGIRYSDLLIGGMGCERLDAVVRTSCLTHTASTDLVHFTQAERISLGVQDGTHLVLESKLSACLSWGAQSDLPDFLFWGALLPWCCGGLWTCLGVDVDFVGWPIEGQTLWWVVLGCSPVLVMQT